MRPRHPPIPRQWLMTDERLGESLWAAIARLPRGGGIVFRHYATPPRARRVLFARVARAARRRGLILVQAGARAGAGAQGHHNRRGPGLSTRGAHDAGEAIAAARQGAHAVFVSPVFATRSHPGTRAMGRMRFGLVALALARRHPQVAVIALGGVDARAWQPLRPLGAYGWAGIDAWATAESPVNRRDAAKARQKRKAVPT